METPELINQIIRQHRKARRYTLREVEEFTGISNAYLSQLETGKVKTPSAKVLYKLARLYNADFEYYLVVAGIIDESPSNLSPSKNILLGENLTESEAAELLKYLTFLRSDNN